MEKIQQTRKGKVKSSPCLKETYFRGNINFIQEASKKESKEVNDYELPLLGVI